MIRRTLGEKIFDIFNVCFLLLLALSTLYPFMNVLTYSLSTPHAANLPGLHFFPTEITFDAFKKVLSNTEVYRAYGNTVIRTVAGVIFLMLLTATTAYPLSIKSFPHRKQITFLMAFSLMFYGGLIPTYLVVKSLGLINTIWALVLPPAVSGFNVIVMRNFMQSIHPELIESAKMDGANEFIVFARIVIPLSAPVLAVVGLWAAVFHWNAWFDAMIYTSGPQYEVLQMFLRRTVLDESNAFILAIDPARELNLYTPVTLKSATIMIITLPILLVYPFIQRFFVKGIMLGSVKG
ncbi:carbohydrate ABC transporter permease [Paenibacillus nasutitermitis]|uniref:Sugar ABC transporter permease n=1 Tax=Paenibacillus nasutitermitis TaxID=1652958 RepID=A0A916Z7X8_9BACL|nr:carbohydrate ABC transporter permease [Paenibacillus nasutitermitis]GGD80269.1 sugar ABC transporter permease [Paenibacillus nasutitermitis]